MTARPGSRASGPLLGIVRGGQGRSASRVTRDSRITGYVLLGFVAGFALAFGVMWIAGG